MTASQAIKAWITERAGQAASHVGLFGLQDDLENLKQRATIKGCRQIQPTKFMDNFPYTASLQLTSMAKPGEGCVRVKAATEEEDIPKVKDKKRMKMLRRINKEEKIQNRPGPPTDSVRNVQTLAGRLETPTCNDITMRNEICKALRLTR